MSNGQPEPPPIPKRTGPPQIPGGHEPPPVPQSSAAFRPSPLPAVPARDAGVGAGQPKTYIEMGGLQAAQSGAVSIGARQQHSFGFCFATFVCWVGLLVMLACIPLSLLGAFFPGFRSPFWLTVLMFSFLVICFEKFVKDKPQASPDVVKLTLRIAYGFFFISLIGLAAAAARAGVYISHVLDGISRAVHKLAESWHESNGIVAWFLNKIDAILQFFTAHAHHAASGTPSPPPTATPAP